MIHCKGPWALALCAHAPGKARPTLPPSRLHMLSGGAVSALIFWLLGAGARGLAAGPAH